MIGRDDQLRDILGYIAKSAAGASHENVLFVTGEAGIGKSTLLHAVQQRCEAMPGAPLSVLVECSTPLAGQDIGEVESLQPWAEIMTALATEEAGQKHDTKKLIGELAMAWVRCVPIVGDVLESVIDTAKIVRRETGAGGEHGQPTAAANQQQVFQQYINFLLTLSERAPLVLMIDDFHWADTSSTNLLFTAARQLREKPVLFIIAYRADDAASSRSGEGHPLLHIRNELERYSLCVEIGVPRMTPGDLDALLRSRYPNYQNNDAFEEWLATISSGNALFITQFLDTLEEDGYVTTDAGIFNDRYDEVRVPASAFAVVQERIRRLSEETRELLRYASVEGDTFTAAVLAKITELPQLKLLQKLRLAEETYRVVRSLGKQRIYSSETTAYQFTHMLLHKAMYDSLGEEERELLHDAVFTVLKEEWERARETKVNLPGIAARLAVHAEVMGENSFAAEVLLAGARWSWGEFAEEETLRQLESALAALDRLGQRSTGAAQTLRAEILLLRGDVHGVRGRFEDALRDIRTVRLLVDSTTDAALSTEVDIAEISLLQHAGRYDDAERIARTVLAGAESEGDAGLHADALGNIGIICMNTGRYNEALDCFRQGRELWESIGDRNGVAKALNNIGLTKINLGQYSDVLEELEESARIFAELGSSINEAHTLNTIGLVYYSTNDPTTALEYFERSAALNRRIGDRLAETAIEMNIGLLHLKLEQVDAGLEKLHHALELATELSSPHFISASLLNIGGVYCSQGDFERGREYTQRSYDTASAAGNLGTSVRALINLGMIHDNLHEHDRAREIFLQALELVQQLGWRGEEADLHNQLGLVAEHNALASEGEERAASYRMAVQHMEESVRIGREAECQEVGRWEEDLERVREMDGAKSKPQ